MLTLQMLYFTFSFVLNKLLDLLITNKLLSFFIKYIKAKIPAKINTTPNIPHKSEYAGSSIWEPTSFIITEYRLFKKCIIMHGKREFNFTAI